MNVTEVLVQVEDSDEEFIFSGSDDEDFVIDLPEQDNSTGDNTMKTNVSNHCMHINMYYTT